MDEGCAVLIGILVGLALVIAAIYFVALAIAFTLAYLGLTIIIPIDFLSSAFAWLGVSDPALGWMLLGCLGGATVGLAKGLKRAERRSDGLKIYGGATLVGILLLVGAYFANAERDGTPYSPTTTNTNLTPSQNTTPMATPTPTPRLRRVNRAPTRRGVE
ncbi:MAG TPA: hypothetical protein VK421_01235 [Pyrinomonadaceae bacterium]|nr:hypothetical protein [Pyrinomonadaceae bacterium]